MTKKNNKLNWKNQKRIKKKIKSEIKNSEKKPVTLQTLEASWREFEAKQEQKEKIRQEKQKQIEIENQRQEKIESSEKNHVKLKPIRFNKRDFCFLCKQPPEDDFELIKHHVSYFPEKVAYVHFDCHMKIHDPENPIKDLIQFKEGDSRRFYEIQNE